MAQTTDPDDGPVLGPVYYAVLGEGGHLTVLGEVQSGTADDVPEGAMPLTPEQFAQAVGNLGGFRWDGKDLVPSVAPVWRTCTPLEFMALFEESEEDAITVAAAQAAAAGQPRLQRFLNRLVASQLVEFDHPDLKSGMDALVAAELLTRARADEILAGGAG